MEIEQLDMLPYHEELIYVYNSCTTCTHDCTVLYKAPRYIFEGLDVLEIRLNSSS